MESIIKLKNEYNSLDTLNTFLSSKSEFECSKEYDVWDHRVDTNGQMEQCLVMKKSGMHAVKIHFNDDNSVKLRHIIPNKIMNAYFGKSEKRYRSILEIIGGKIKDVALIGSQKQAFEELEKIVRKAS